MVVDQPTRLSQPPSPPPAAAQSELAIRVRDASKMYRIYDRPRDRLKQMLWRGRRVYGREFWALRGVSFEVQRGEAVGIIGRNGSGKSTLLQIIAGTLAPTEGEVEVSGRVAALLELGSGFNPEFTGRENVFLNGAILGIGRDDINDRFDEIAAFADIGEFIDQPVKIYSSGMMLRLAFAVQAHLQPDVLIVDEALSVGDLYFQHKCMRRIKQLVDQGTTLLFVSHDTATVKRFCRRGLWLEAGQAHYYGEAGVAAEKYLAFTRMRDLEGWAPSPVEQEGSFTATEAPTPLLPLDQLLPHVASELDLSDNRLFLRGRWEWATSAETPLLARRTTDPTALAGFRCGGNRVDLAFFAGPQACPVRVTIDGQERILDLYHPIEQQVEKISLEVKPGQHIVLIGPAEHVPGHGAEVCWLGGRACTTPHLTFRRDASINLNNSAVERYGSGKARLTAVDLLDYNSGQPVSPAAFGQRVRLRVHAERLEPAGPRLEFSFVVRDQNRIDLFGTSTIDEQIRLDSTAEQFVVEFAFDIRLGPGSYSILVAFVECSEDLSYKVPMDQIDIAAVFTVTFDPLRPVWYIFNQPVTVEVSVI
jgi:ABC-type polysaccharide/polyol phosphate transport system ATPase subunit